MRKPPSSPRASAACAAALLAAAVAAVSPARAAAPPILLFADHDDDDANGVPDDEQADVPGAPELVSVPRPAGGWASGPVTLRGTGGARVLVDGHPLPPGSRVPAAAPRVQLEGVRAGHVEIAGVAAEPLAVTVLEIRALDGAGHDVDLARSHASTERIPPERLGDDPFGNSTDPDALRFVVAGPAEDLPGTLTLHSFSPAGAPIDALPDVPLGDIPCPPGLAAGMTCGSTRPIRLVADDVDRRHPLIAERSLLAELGGAVAVVSARGEKLQMIRVAGPRTSPAGPIGRYRARLEVIMVRATPHGPPPMGGTDDGAREVARAEVARANGLWAACGVSFGPVSDLDVLVVDPPGPHLVALGCDQGLPASGGAVRLRVDGREVTARIAAGMRPSAAARVVAKAIADAGFVSRVSDNVVIGSGAFGSADVLVRRKGGALASVEPPAAGPVSSDATMTACIGRVDMEDGLQHFGDVDAIAGTVEERALIKAFDDLGPGVIKVFLVPSFAGGGRIGESFIGADGGATRNVLIEDRGGVRAGQASFAMAHELGHVLLDDPGHPDDFGTDTPTRLMDADAANASAFGPRRLLVEECARAIRQSGPGAPVPLLTLWSLRPLGKDGAKGRR
jgi:hypothetical protein